MLRKCAYVSVKWLIIKIDHAHKPILHHEAVHTCTHVCLVADTLFAEMMARMVPKVPPACLEVIMRVYSTRRCIYDIHHLHGSKA